PALPTTYTYDGAEHNVSITNASGTFGLGGITVKYNGLTTEPKNAGTYKVNASIAAGSNYSAAEIYVGNIIINKKTPVLTDLNYTIPSSVNFTGEAQPVSVKANTSVNGLGEITVKYKGANGDTVPINATAYQVNVSIADGTNYNATETDITIGTLTINKVVPSESDFTLTPTSAVYNGANLTTVVSAKYSGMGDITNVTYNDEENVSAVGEYIVRVNVTRGNNYHAADYVNAGNFTITQPVNPPSPSRSGGGTDTGSGNYKEYDRSVTNGGTVSFGSSPTVTSVDLPAGVSGSVALIAESDTPAPKGKETVKIFEINIPNYPSGKESSVQFKLTVAEIEKAGYTPADICLYHCDAKGLWTKLPTMYTVKDGTVYYEAVTTEFSPFAIVYEKGSAKADETIVVPTATAEPLVTVTAPAQTATSSVQPTATATASPLCAAGLIAGLGCVLLAIRRK
ncbi:MAG: MBG domain-containing protein, partial [Methanocorpusculum sp.]|nr:MBG domain-containing protein [Methanocorpusculum sp.]